MAMMATLSSMSGLVNGIGNAFQTVGNIAGAVWDWIYDKIKAVIDGVVDAFDAVSDWWESWTFGDLWDGFLDIVSISVDGIVGFFAAIGNWFVDLWVDIETGWMAFETLLSVGVGAILGWFAGIGDWFVDLWTDIETGWLSFEASIGTGVDAILGWFAGIGKWYVDLWKDIGSGWLSFELILAVGVQTVSNYFTGLFNTIVDYIPDIFSKSFWTELFDFSWLDWDSVFDFSLPSWLTWLTDIDWSELFTIDWGVMWDGLISGGQLAITGAIAIIEGMLNGIIDGINWLLEEINDVSSYVGIPAIPTIGSIDLGRPSFADGGIASGPMSGYTAELHGTEAVVPLPDGRSIPVEMKGNSSGNQTFNITVEANGITDRTDKRAMARDIGNMIQQELARTMGGSTKRGRFA